MTKKKTKQTAWRIKNTARKNKARRVKCNERLVKGIESNITSRVVDQLDNYFNMRPTLEELEETVHDVCNDLESPSIAAYAGHDDEANFYIDLLETIAHSIDVQDIITLTKKRGVKVRKPPKD